MILCRRTTFQCLANLGRTHRLGKPLHCASSTICFQPSVDSRETCDTCATLRRDMSTSSRSSVSAQEVEKFSEMDASWWDARRNPLIAMNPVRVRYMLEALKQKGVTSAVEGPPLQGCKALDVGCGGGLLSESLGRLGADVTAIDPSKSLVEMARRHAELDPLTQTIDYRGGISVEDLVQQAPEQKFDIICILEVLEHATDVDGLLQAATALLKPPSHDCRGGMLFVSTINRTWKSHALAIVGTEYVMGYLPVGTHAWDQFQTPDEVERRMKRVGLEPVDVCGIVLAAPPICGNWQWLLDSKDTDVNWIGAYQHLPTQG